MWAIYKTQQTEPKKRQSAFTIVELLIVIVVIGILATITVAAYNGIQERARNTKINSDLAQLEKAIHLARIQTGKTLYGITGGGSAACMGQPTGTDINSVQKTDPCWTKYATTLSLISDASGMDVKNLYDPWGRPYQIYESEGRATPTTCTKDWIGGLQNPHVYWAPSPHVQIPNSLVNC